MITTAVVLLAGCMRNATTPPSASPQTESIQSTAQPGDTPDAMARATPWVKDEENTAPAEGDIQTPTEAKQQVKALEHALETLAEVDDAAVVAIERIALVGLGFANQYQGGLDRRIKDTVLTQIQNESFFSILMCLYPMCVFDTERDCRRWIAHNLFRRRRTSRLYNYHL